MLQLISDDVVYKGFQRHKPGSTGKVVIVWFEGDPELYDVESEAGLAELKRYWTGQWGDPNADGRMTYEVLEHSPWLEVLA